MPDLKVFFAMTQTRVRVGILLRPIIIAKENGEDTDFFVWIA